jgi:hypothetical protein
MEQNKYYTPTIEEFHVGFEFESNYVLFKKENKSDVWNKHILTQDELWFWDSWKNDAVDTEFRVKSLDKEDIESLGWINGETRFLGGFVFDDNKELKTFYQMYLGNFIINKGLYLQIHSNVEVNYIFQGFIKNKSELKKLMVQLDILK